MYGLRKTKLCCRAEQVWVLFAEDKTEHCCRFKLLNFVEDKTEFCCRFKLLWFAEDKHNDVVGLNRGVLHV